MKGFIFWGNNETIVINYHIDFGKYFMQTEANTTVKGQVRLAAIQYEVFFSPPKIVFK